jgi:hypothetical protein
MKARHRNRKEAQRLAASIGLGAAGDSQYDRAIRTAVGPDHDSWPLALHADIASIVGLLLVWIRQVSCCGVTLV